MTTITRASPMRQASLSIVAAGILLLGAATYIYTTAARADVAEPVLSAISATPTGTGGMTATVMWTTDVPASSQVAYGSGVPYTATTTLDNSLVGAHSVFLGGLTPNTTYHFAVMSMTSTGSTTMSSDMTFMTGSSTASTTGTGGTGITTATTTDNSALQAEITALEMRVTTLEAEVAALIGGTGGGTGTTTGGGGAGSAIVVNSGGTVRAGTSFDFGGQNFGSEEHVKVTQNGNQVGNAFTNIAGGFTTGSIGVPSVPGTYTYTFMGLTSGRTAQATLTVTP